MGRFIFALVISLVSLNDVDASPGCDLIPGSDEGWLFQLFEEYGHPMYREFTHIEDGQRQFPEIFFIDKDRVVRTQITNQGASDLAEITMKRGSRARPTDLQKVDPDALSDDQAFNLWFRSEKEPGLGQYAQMVKQGLMADPSAVAEAKRYAISKGHRIQNSMTGDIHLSNQGAQSYFEFIPEGRTDSVHARVLNIYTDHEHVDDYFSRRNPPEVANILVEFIGQKQSDGTRLRTVHQMRTQELDSIVDSDDARKTAHSVFEDSLNIFEIQTKKLAIKNGLPLYSMTNVWRNLNPESSLGKIAPLTTLNINTWIAMDGSIKEVFGAPIDLYTASEKELERFNIIDVFSRLNPRYVLDRFGFERGSGMEYAWVITEDGQLKISPHMKIGNNLKPQLLRLAGARRIYSGGKFTWSSPGTVRVKMISNGYSQNEFYGRGSTAQLGQNNQSQTIEDWIQNAFETQAGVDVNEVGGSTIHSSQSNAAGSGSRQERTKRGEFFDPASPKPTSGAQKDGKKAFWNWPENSPKGPDEFKTWCGYAGQVCLEKDARKYWAAYVLRSSPESSVDQLKKAYRRLVKKYHPDKSDHPLAEQIIQMLNEAKEILGW